MTGIERAVKIMGSRYKMANLLNIDRQLVDYWIKTGRPAPHYCIAINEATGVPLYKLRPDVYPKPKNQPRANIGP